MQKNLNAVFKLMCKRYGIIPSRLCWTDFKGKDIIFNNASDRIKAKQTVAHGTNDSDDSESNARSGDNKCKGSRLKFHDAGNNNKSQ
jgi:hypothetical protein